MEFNESNYMDCILQYEQPLVALSPMDCYAVFSSKGGKGRSDYYAGLCELIPLGKPPELFYDQAKTYRLFEALNDLLNYIYNL